MKEVWNYLLAEPFVWIFYAFFQPHRLHSLLGSQSLWKRFLLMLRLIVPMFLLTYLIGIVEQILFIPFHVWSHTGIVSILLIMGFGIAGGIVVGIAVGVVVSIPVGTVYGIAIGVVGGGIVAGMAAFGIVGGDVAFGIVSGVAFGIAFSVEDRGIEGGIMIGILGGGLVFGIVFGPLFGIAFGIAGSTAVVSAVEGVVFGIAFGVEGGIVIGIVFGIAFSIVFGIVLGIVLGICISISFILCYFIAFYRLPFCAVRGNSAFTTYRASRMNPSEVFEYLRSSSLHWDTVAYLPLSYLKKTLLIAYDQDAERALKEITFIVTERPRQLQAARATLLEIAVRDLVRRKTMSEIAGAIQILKELFPQEAGLLVPSWSTPISRLREASLCASRFCSRPVGRKARLEELQEMLKHIEDARQAILSGHRLLNSRLVRIISGRQQLNDRFVWAIKVWQIEAEQERKKLEKLPDYTGRIDNPYNPGNALEPNDPLFSGRMDLVQMLRMELEKGERRPTFLMTGERRMGKSSTLRQLPCLLDSRFLPVFYDLQRSGILASTLAFLGELAEGIYKELHVRGMSVKMLEYRTLRSGNPYYVPETVRTHARHEGKASGAYDIFNKWLSDIEILLEEEDRTLLLLFDEFEKLEKVGQKEAFDLPLLLDWLRSTIQYHPRIALLFSGVHTIGEMGKEAGLNWSGYFVNVQTLHVSFLHEDEARRLIVQPVPNFPGTDIYDDDVVECILAETGSHPFLVQAVCSALIDMLNVKKKNCAEINDMAVAIDMIFNNWGDTYFRDLWMRTDDNQRVCLMALRKLYVTDRVRIQQETGLDEGTVWRTLDALVKRDLVRKNGVGTYCISTPIFSEWVERSRYLVD